MLLHLIYLIMYFFFKDILMCLNILDMMLIIIRGDYIEKCFHLWIQTISFVTTFMIVLPNFVAFY
jgi:hypothetical protein